MYEYKVFSVHGFSVQSMMQKLAKELMTQGDGWRYVEMVRDDKDEKSLWVLVERENGREVTI